MAAPKIELLTTEPPGVHTKAGRRLIADELRSMAYDIDRVFRAEGGDPSYLVAELNDIADRLSE